MGKTLWVFIAFGVLPILTIADEADEYFKKGIEYADEGKSNEAIQEFEQAIKANPNHAEAHCMLGIEIYKQSVPQRDESLLRQAIQELERAIQINPNLGIAHDVVAFAYYILGQFETSRQHHLTAKRLGFPNPVLERKLNQAFKMLEKQEELKEEQNSSFP